MNILEFNNFNILKNSKSIVSLLEDCNQHPGMTDESFVCELNKQFGQRIHFKRHIRPQSFEVVHFAENVRLIVVQIW